MLAEVRRPDDPVPVEEFKDKIREQYDAQGSPYYSTARLWDDGIIDPVDTRRVLGMGLAAAARTPRSRRRPTASSGCDGMPMLTPSSSPTAARSRSG